jgi:8-oxo-dGTP pyrophosphatase MutT (NUDIX family)
MEIYFNEKGESVEKPENVQPEWRISGYVLIGSGGKTLVVRSVWSDKWELPGGRIELGESIKGGILRECREETGYRVEVGEQPIYVGENNYYCTDIDRYFKAVLLVYTGNLVGDIQDKETVDPAIKEEIAELQWIDAGELREVDFNPVFRPAIGRFLETKEK